VISDTEAVYLYGLDIIAQQQSERLYYVHDGLGSVRQLLDTTGQIDTNYAYDPFGVPLVGGDVYNPYQFTGEGWDAEVGLLYLRARYYQPEVGRFITKDPWPGHADAPGTLNRYNYVMGNPATVVDGSGLASTGPGPETFGLQGGHPSSDQTHDPLTQAQWELSKQEAAVFQLPVELVAGTIAVEIVHDTEWHDPVFDAMLASGLAFHYLGQSGNVPDQYAGICWFTSGFLAGYEHYWGVLGGRGPGPGVANFHVGTAKTVEQYYADEYPDWRVLEKPPDVYLRMTILLSERGSIHYAAAYLRYWADLRKGNKAPHRADLSDIDMQLIYSGFREDIGYQYDSLEQWQVSQDPSPYGRLMRYME